MKQKSRLKFLAFYGRSRRANKPIIFLGLRLHYVDNNFGGISQCLFLMQKSEFHILLYYNIYKLKPGNIQNFKQKCQWRHQGGYGGMHFPPILGHGECIPPWRLCTPYFPPSQEGKNGKNQPFSANFWIFAPSKKHYAPSMPPQKYIWCHYWNMCWGVVNIYLE